ncbi:MAG: hypothetical protein FVQ82_07110 [Planctomycetes bacterium]|nr:hypothetical protein [Planctomycetota bacterium]
MRHFVYFVLAVFCIFVGGCFEDIGRGIDEFAGGILGINAKSEATVAEIDAVGKLESGEAMLEGLLAVAGRSGISKRAQVRLVETSLNKLNDEDAGVNVLLALIGNDDFCHEAKKKILNNTGKLKSEDNKAKIVGAINSRVIGLKTAIPPNAGTIKSVLSEN